MKRYIFVLILVACKSSDSTQEIIKKNTALIETNGKLYDSENNLFMMYLQQGNPKAQDHKQTMDSLLQVNDSLLKINTALLNPSNK
jgi:hypothetical protein